MENRLTANEVTFLKKYPTADLPARKKQSSLNREQRRKQTKIKMSDFENPAVRSFLLLYGADTSLTIYDMCSHMEMSGYKNPDFTNNWTGEHLTKEMAQLWLRWLFTKYDQV